MSGKTEPKYLIAGGVSSLFIAYFCVRYLMAKGMRTDAQYYLAGVDPFRFVVYFFWLIFQIMKSALYVSIVATISSNELKPSVAWFRADYDNPAACAMLANSITLTPGTVTIEIGDNGVYSVHTLTDYLRNGLLDGSMQQKVAWLYHESIEFEVLETSIEHTETSSQVVYSRLRKTRFRRNGK